MARNRSRLFGGGIGDRFTSVPPRRSVCQICGSDTHTTSQHQGKYQDAAPPVGSGICTICGQDTHTTANHPGINPV